jgi:uncharacterized protein
MAIQEFTQPAYHEEIVKRITGGFHPLKIILFGSWARGDARPDSDYDLLVVLPQVDNKRRSAVQVGNSLRDLPISKNIVVTTPGETAARGNMNRDVLPPALREGIGVYETSHNINQVPDRYSA